jgi:anthranilate 1,2-dioxygenase small subunit
MSVSLQQRVEQFYYAYAATLNDARYAEWPNYFDPADSRYEVLSRENVDAGLPLALMGCISHGMIIDRVTMLVNNTLTYRKMYFRHMISNVRAEARGNGSVNAKANILVMQTDLEGVSSLYAVGRYDTDLVTRDDQFLIRANRVILDTFAIDNMLAVPL